MIRSFLSSRLFSQCTIYRCVSTIEQRTLGIYEKRSDETLEKLSDYISIIGDESNRDVDVSLSMGVLSINIPDTGTFVINKQRPNLQIWLSSPLSGPRRYELVNDKWKCVREKEFLEELLNREFSQIFPSSSIDFSDHI